MLWALRKNQMRHTSGAWVCRQEWTFLVSIFLFCPLVLAISILGPAARHLEGCAPVRVLRQKSRWQSYSCSMNSIGTYEICTWPVSKGKCLAFTFILHLNLGKNRASAFHWAALRAFGLWEGTGTTEPPTKHRQFDGVTAWMLLFEQQHAVPSATEKDISQSSFDGAIYLWSALSSPESMKHNWNFLQGPNRSTWRAVYLLFIFESSHIWQPKTIGKCSRCEQRHDERVVGSRKHEIGRIEAFFKEKCTGSVCFSGCLMLWLEDLPSGRLVWRTWLAPGVSHCGLKCT